MAEAATTVPQSTTTRRKFTIRKRQNVNAARTMEEPTDLGQISANVFGGPGPERRLLCDTNFTKRIVDTGASLVNILPSSTRLGEGSFGFTTSAELHVKPTKGANSGELSCISALKTIKSVDPEIPTDILVEIATYARTKLKPCIAQGLYAKVLASQVKFVMEHYIKDLNSLYSDIVGPNFQSFESNCELLAKCLTFQVLTGLKGLHDEHIFHRDLKPENVLLAHTGNVFVTDFGLSLHDPLGIKRARDYFLSDTTATIKPPEAVDGAPVNSKFDIWSAGCCLGYFLTFDYSFDFWKGGRRWEDDVRANGTTSEFGYKRDRLLKTVSGYTHTKTGKDLYSAECVDLLETLLELDPAKRPSAEEALKHSWFKGLTLKAAQKYVQEIFVTRRDTSHVYVGPPPRISYIRDKTRRVKEAAKRQDNAGVASNTELSEYVLVVPASASQTDWKPAAPSVSVRQIDRAKMVVTALSYLTQFQTIPLTAFLHAIELNDRATGQLGTQLTPLMFAPLFLSGYLLAVKVNPIGMSNDASAYFDSTAVSQLTQRFYSVGALQTGMRSLIRVLRGDLFPLRGGFVEQVVRNLLLKDGLKPATDAPMILRRLLCLLVAYSCLDTKKHTFDVILGLAYHLALIADQRPEYAPPMPANLTGAHTALKAVLAGGGGFAQEFQPFWSLLMASVRPEALPGLDALFGISFERVAKATTSFKALIQNIERWFPSLL